MKRRVAVARTRGDVDRIPVTGRTTNELYSAGAAQDNVDRNILKDKRRWHPYLELGKKLAQTDRYLRHDREVIFFLFLAIFGGALVVIASFTLNKSGTSFSRVAEMLSILSGSRKGHKITHFTANIFGPQHKEFREIIPTYFGQTFDCIHPKRQKLQDVIIKEKNSFDFGGLDLGFQESEKTGTRRIRYDSMQMLSNFRDYRTVDRDDDQDNYYAYDDDYLRDPFNNLDEDDENCCRRISEHRLYFPNCNSFHETPLLESEATHIGAGEYRQAMRIKIYFAQEKEIIVVKDIHLSNNLDYRSYEFTRMDAIVAERLTASPRIYNIYGNCGIGIMAEYFPHGQLDEIVIPEVDDIISYTDDKEGPLICYNDLSGLIKLGISLHMAEALADLHGFSGGAIVHQDVKLDQFFLNADKSGVILSDFNRAEFLLWNHCDEEYCGYTEGYGSGNWRSPEEYYDDWLTEKVDVFSLGNNMYSLLTGLMPFHEVTDIEEVQYRVGTGEKPYIDPRYKERSLAEERLVEIIEKCHEYDEENRPSIFEVVDLLWQAIEEVQDTTNKNR